MDRESFFNDLRLWIFQKKKKISPVPSGSWKSRRRKGQPWKTQVPREGGGKAQGEPSCRCLAGVTPRPVTSGSHQYR